MIIEAQVRAADKIRDLLSLARCSAPPLPTDTAPAERPPIDTHHFRVVCGIKIRSRPLDDEGRIAELHCSGLLVHGVDLPGPDRQRLDSAADPSGTRPTAETSRDFFVLVSGFSL